MNATPIERLNAALAGRYVIDRELGEGGMAKVYLADDLKHERKVALKVLKPELAAVVGAERFLSEIKTTANLQHPHILPLFDSGEADSFLFYVMPYIDGETLRDRIDREKQLPIDEALGIATAVANALQTAHEQGIIHRDIKPANILLSRGEPLVSDFGIAIAVGAAGGSRLTETGLSVGTPYYMSPEQATGDQAVGAASDTYALACVLYEMLVGEPPYLGNTAQAVLGKIIQGLPVSATAARKSIPRNVDAAIRKGLEKIPADRFTSAQAFARALADPAFVHGTADIGVGGVRPVWKAVAIGASVAAMALAGVAAWALQPAPEVSQPVYRFESPFGTGEGGIGPQAFRAISDDGSLIIFGGPSEDGGRQLWIRRLDDVEATPVRGTQGATSAVLSPDGDELAFVQEDDAKVLPLQGGPVRSLGVQGAQITTWGPDGYVYFFAALGGQPFRVPASGGPSEEIGPPDSAPDGPPQLTVITDVLPGGTTGLVTTGTGNADFEIRSIDLTTGEQKTLIPGGGGARYTPSGHMVYFTVEGLLMAVRFDPATQEVQGDPVAMLDNVANAVLSRTGTLLYSTRPATANAGAIVEVEPVWVTRTGEVSSIDAGWTFELGTDPNWGMRLSPDGAQLAVRHFANNNYDIWVKRLEVNGQFSRLTFDEAQERMPRWSADGRTVTFLSSRNNKYEVWQRPADGTGTDELVYSHEASLAQGFRSPDGEWVVMRTVGVANVVGGRDIVAAQTGVDSVARALLTEEYDEAAPELSPDGRWLAYDSNETGRYEVFVRPFPDVDAAKVQVSNAGGIAPLWSDDGDELFYQDGNAELISVTFETEPEFRIVARTPLFTWPEDVLARYSPGSFAAGQYDVAPDGRFLMVRNAGAADPAAADLEPPEEPRVVLVLNWFEELKARVGN